MKQTFFITHHASTEQVRALYKARPWQHEDAAWLHTLYMHSTPARLQQEDRRQWQQRRLNAQR